MCLAWFYDNGKTTTGAALMEYDICMHYMINYKPGSFVVVDFFSYYNFTTAGYKHTKLAWIKRDWRDKCGA